MNDLRSRLEDELAVEAQPPTADLVAGALRQGRRQLHRRRLAATATAVLVVVALGAVGWLAPWRTVAVPQPADPTPGPTRPATAATVVAELGRELPAGVRLVSAYRYEQDPPAAAVYLDHGEGAGLLQLSIDSYPPTGDTCRTGQCRTGADGSTTVIGTTAGDCQESTVVQRYRPDGVHISVYLGTCLMWDGHAYPPAPAPLTVDQAIALTADPHWGARMDAELVTEAAARYPALPLWVGR